MQVSNLVSAEIQGPIPAQFSARVGKKNMATLIYVPVFPTKICICSTENQPKLGGETSLALPCFFFLPTPRVEKT